MIRSGKQQTPVVLLTIGILTRCLVFLYLGPQNNDGHLGVIQFLAKYAVFPDINQNMLAFHPPLYYWMAAPVWSLFQSAKAVQFLSLLISIATLAVLYQIIYRTELIADPRARIYSFLLACFLPQFVMFGLYISNDTLTFLLGSVLILQLCRYLVSPDRTQSALLAIVTGLGLLTKTTFLVFLPVLAAAVLFVEFHERRSYRAALWATAAFLLLSCALGSYKYVNNYARYRSPLINSLDQPRTWATVQKASYRGVYSYLDFDVLHLVASPSVSDATSGSYPLLLYGTFWYQHIPESNFFGSQVKPYAYLGSLIYLVALVPTAVFLAGLFRLTRQVPEFLTTFDHRRPGDRGRLGAYAAGALLLANLALVVATVTKYHVWSLMQGRYLFTTIAGAFAVFCVGVEAMDQTRLGSIVLKSCMFTLTALFCLYLASEVGYLMVLKSNPAIRSWLKTLA